MRGLDLLGAMDDSSSTAAAAAAMAQKAQQQPKAASSSGGGMSWPMIGGAVLAVVAMVLAVPWILKNA